MAYPRPKPVGPANVIIREGDRTPREKPALVCNTCGTTENVSARFSSDECDRCFAAQVSARSKDLDHDQLKREMRAATERKTRQARRANIIALALTVALLVLVAMIRFANPALTETQLFLEFWPLWLGISVSVLGLRWWLG